MWKLFLRKSTEKKKEEGGAKTDFTVVLIVAIFGLSQSFPSQEAAQTVTIVLVERIVCLGIT